VNNKKDLRWAMKEKEEKMEKMREDHRKVEKMVPKRFH